MWAWISQHSATLGVLISLGSTVVWLLYFQLFYISYSRQRRTQILINRAGPLGKERCLVSNMGAEPLYVVSILAVLRDSSVELHAPITDLDATEIEHPKHAKEATNQGPLKPGEYMDIGQFSDLMARCMRSVNKPEDMSVSKFDELQVLVIGAFGSDDLFVGAKRSFRLATVDGEANVTPTDISTAQLRSRRERRGLESYLAEQR